jgi:hypothetical protein
MRNFTERLKDVSSKYFGATVGFVKDIQDNEKLRRIRVLCPYIAEGEPLMWANPCDTGRTDWLPKVGDMVFISFQDGDVEHPVWLGLATSEQDLSDEFRENYSHDFRIDRDYNGNKVEWKSDGIYFNGGDEPVVLGDKNAVVLTDLLDGLKEVANNLSSVAAAIPLPNVVAAMTALLINLDLVDSKIDETKSEKVRTG